MIDSDEEFQMILAENSIIGPTTKSTSMETTKVNTPAVDKGINSTRSDRKRKFNEYLKSPSTVEIIVGPERETWILNEDFLCERLPFFKAVFKSGFKESETKKLELPEDSPMAFGHLIDWIYTKETECHFCAGCGCDHCKEHNPETEEHTSVHLLQWAWLWVLADKIGSKSLEDEAAEKFSSCMDGVPLKFMPDVVGLVFEKTPDRCVLRRYLMSALVGSFFEPAFSNLEAFTQVTAASKSFNNLVWKEIKDHMAKEKKRCRIWGCMTHKPASEKDKN